MSETFGPAQYPNRIVRPPNAKFQNSGPAPKRPPQVETRPENTLLPKGLSPGQTSEALVKEMREQGPTMGEQALPETPNGRIMSVWGPEVRSLEVEQAINADPFGTAALETIAMKKNQAVLSSLAADMRQGTQRITEKPLDANEAKTREGKWAIASEDGKSSTTVQVPRGIVAKALAAHAPTINAQNSYGFNMSPMVEISQIQLEGQTYTAVKVSSISTVPEGKQFDPNNTKDSFFTRAKDVWGATVDNMRNSLKHAAASLDRTASTLVVYNDKGERVAEKNADGWIFGH